MWFFVLGSEWAEDIWFFRLFPVSLANAHDK